MNGTSGGIVINLNTYGATVRLDEGELASASVHDVETHRDEYQRSLDRAASGWRSKCAARAAVLRFLWRRRFATTT